MLSLPDAIERAMAAFGVAHLPSYVESAKYNGIFPLTTSLLNGPEPLVNLIFAYGGESIVQLLQFEDYHFENVLPAVRSFTGLSEQSTRELFNSRFCSADQDLRFVASDAQFPRGYCDLNFQQLSKLRLLILDSPLAFGDLHSLARIPSRYLDYVKIGGFNGLLLPVFALLNKQSHLRCVHLNGVDLISNFCDFRDFIGLLKSPLEVLDVSGSQIDVTDLAQIEQLSAMRFLGNDVAFGLISKDVAINEEIILYQFSLTLTPNRFRRTITEIFGFLADNLTVQQTADLKTVYRSPMCALIQRSPSLRNVSFDGSLLLSTLCNILCANARLPVNRKKSIFQAASNGNFPRSKRHIAADIKPNPRYQVARARSAHNCVVKPIYTRLDRFLEVEDACLYHSRKRNGKRRNL